MKTLTAYNRSWNRLRRFLKRNGTTLTELLGKGDHDVPGVVWDYIKCSIRYSKWLKSRRDLVHSSISLFFKKRASRESRDGKPEQVKLAPVETGENPFELLAQEDKSSELQVEPEEEKPVQLVSEATPQAEPEEAKGALTAPEPLSEGFKPVLTRSSKRKARIVASKLRRKERPPRAPVKPVQPERRRLERRIVPPWKVKPSIPSGTNSWFPKPLPPPKEVAVVKPARQAQPDVRPETKSQVPAKPFSGASPLTVSSFKRRQEADLFWSLPSEKRKRLLGADIPLEHDPRYEDYYLLEGDMVPDPPVRMTNYWSLLYRKRHLVP
jgi:hypothetical protein